MLKKRQILQDLDKFLKTPVNLLFLGSRQVGKSSVLQIIQTQLVALGIATAQQILSFDMESGNDLQLAAKNTPEQFVNLLYSRSGLPLGTPLYVFLDEIQYIPRASSFIKLLSDHFKQIRLFLTGSSGLEIKRIFSDRLTGRKITFHVRTLSFKEYLDFKEHPLAAAWSKINILEILKSNTDALKNYTAFKSEILPAYEDFVLYGGYPAPSLKENLPLRDKLLADIRDQYARRDVRDILNIENVPGFNTLLGLLAAQIGNLANVDELSNSSNLSRDTVNKYLFLLSETFIINLLRPYFTNKRQELIKMPKVMFNDTGLRNILISPAISPANLELRPDKGALVENSVWHELSLLDLPINYWRAKTQSEVDFVITMPEGALAPVEVKYSSFSKPQIPRGLAAFISRYHPQYAFVITKDYLGKTKEDKTAVHFLPAFLL